MLDLQFLKHIFHSETKYYNYIVTLNPEILDWT